MPTILLGKQSGMYYTDRAVMIVYEEPYPTSNLFRKFKHKPLSYFTPGYTYLYKGSFFIGNYATLQPGTDYYEASLQYADVYFNRFDTSYTPLVCVLKFNSRNNDPRVKDRMYTNSDHFTYINGNSNTNITTLTEFNISVESKLLELLIKESDTHLKTITYELERTNSGPGETSYNSEKITLSSRQIVRDHSLTQFYMHTHKPKNSTPKKSFLLINNKVPMSSKDKHVRDIQGEEYESVNVYYNASDQIPIMIELVTKREKRHLHRITTDGLLWLRSDLDHFNNFRLVRYLNHTTNVMEKKKVEELKKKQELEVQKEQDEAQEREPEQETRSTDEQEPTPTQRGQESTSISPRPERSGTPPRRSKPTLTCNMFVLINKQLLYGTSALQKVFESSKPKFEIPDIQPTIYLISNDLQGTDYVIYTHDIKPDLDILKKQTKDKNIVIELNIYISNFELSLFDTKGVKTKLIYKPRRDGDKLKVYFYQHKSKPPTPDTVPLMIQHDEHFYGPINPDNYFTGWNRLEGIKDTGDKSSIKQKLDTINKELNKIKLDFKNDKTCSYGIPKSTLVQIKEFDTDRIKVKVEQIGSVISQPAPTLSSNGSCSAQLQCQEGPYVKYTHTTINKFKLGSIYYKSKEVKVIEDNEGANSEAKPITIQKQNLLSVYYWINDNTRTYPLLIGIGKQNDRSGSSIQDNIDEYYKLISASNNEYKWKQLKKDEKTGLTTTDNTKLVQLLDKINYEIKKVIKIYIEKQKTYDLCLSTNAGGKGDVYQPDKGKKIEVQPYDKNGCDKLKSSGYICYVHRVSEVTGNGSMLDYNTIGGLKFYISGKNGGGDKDIEIKLHNGGDSGNNQLSQLTYNTCMKNIYVFFYCKPSCTGTESTPTAPLMLLYDSKYYLPQNIDQYFKKWVQEKGLTTTIEKPCGGNNGNHTTLVTKLNEVNKALNRINLTNTTIGPGTSDQYGISPPKEPQQKEPNIELNRINLKKIPSKESNKRPYCKLVHRTMNSFTIGDIWYGQKEITSSGGITINGFSGGSGSPTIKVENNGGSSNHTQFVTGDNKPNTVVAYYHKDDGEFKLPQLIVLMTTDQAISESQTIKASSDSKYGYYVLGSKNGIDYQYEWRTVDYIFPKPFQLDLETEYSLLNAVIIMVDKHKQYRESQIKAAVKSATLTSPGNRDDVNRLKEKTIDAHEETGSRAAEYSDPGKCISKYGYRLWAHDISAFKEWSPTNGQSPGQLTIPLIGALRFLIPSSTSPNGYEEINLYQDEKGKGPGERLYHNPSSSHRNTQNKVYVFFYGSDPRPLLLCYNGNAYIPQKTAEPTKKKQVNVNYTEWTRETKITQCTCMGDLLSPNDENILDALLEVVCFLNPVQINPKEIPSEARSVITDDEPPITSESTAYDLHEYKESSYVKMKITRTNVSCYEQYKYEPGGTTGNNGDGFRLGTVFYTSIGEAKTKSTLNYYELSPSSKYLSLVKVIVYYYDHDLCYSEPLLIELTFEVNLYVETINKKEYWKLDKLGAGSDTIKWIKDNEAEKQIAYSNNTQKIVNYLDTIRYNFKNVLQVCIAIKQAGEYSVNLLDRTNSEILNPEDTIDVNVSEETDCKSLTGTGFKCFKHCISNLGSENLHKIGGLSFVIPNESKSEVKLKLYDSPKTGVIHPMYYNCGMGDIYVYFYGSGNGNGDGSTNNGDPRPLLLCYNNSGYRPKSMSSYNAQVWFKAKKITDCGCDKTDKNLLPALAHVSNFLNPVLIHETTGTYNIHSFNGQQISIKVTKIPGSDKFCYSRYTHTHNGINNDGSGFRLGTINYRFICIQVKTKKSLCISSLITYKPNYDPASEIVVYYYKGDPNHLNPLLVVLCNNRTGASTTPKCQPYYELQRSSTTTAKRYKKVDNIIELNSGKGKQLEKTLDRILFYISKSLLIDLSFRKTDKPKEVETPKKQCTKTWEGAYISKVYENESIRNLKKTDETINVIVFGPTNIVNDKKEKTGYQCYQHKLTGIKEYEQIGGLRLFLWDNRTSDEKDTSLDDCKVTGPTTKDNKKQCCEIKLYEKCNQTGGSSSHQPIDPIAYTTCKGDLYVYFYGSDPRPLLLCYNNGAYVPQNMEEYNQKWCHVKEIESCECSEKKFDPQNLAKLLRQLHKTSMFLNPVKLSETIQAYEKVIKPVIEKRRKEAKEKGEPVGKWPEHNYTVQTFGHIDIKMKVQATDLLCYRPFISNRDLLRYKNMCKSILIMY